VLAAILLGGCVTIIDPSPSPPPSTVAQQTPEPAPTVRSYTVVRGDTLQRIASRFGLTIGQLLTANPEITDPNLIAIGQVIVVPPPGAPDRSGATGGIPDARDDQEDPVGEPMIGEGFADISGLGVREDRGVLRVELALAARPPAASDPEFEALDYVVVIDVDDDDQPDYRIKWSNQVEGEDGLAPSFEDRGNALILAGAAFPGGFEVRRSALVWTIDGSALGGGRRWRLAARVERTWYPGGRSDPEAETSIDYAPDIQWPQPNARWVELGAPLGGE
jgi:LysM repeat protein